MLFESNITATFTMTAFDTGRNLQIHGTRGQLIGGEWFARHAQADIVVTDHATGEVTKYNIPHSKGGYDGHGGGDVGLIDMLYEQMLTTQPGQMRSSITQSVQSHLMGFAAEASRMTGKVVQMKSNDSNNM
jgi:hypothetical protein